MARELARLGHDVEVINNCLEPGNYQGVTYRHKREFVARASSQEWDICVAHRFFQALPLIKRAKSTWLWLHDMPVEPKMMAGNLYATENMVVLSDFHRDAYLKAVPELGPITWASRNGVDLKMIEASTAGAKRDPKLFVYASRPERGLQRLLQDIWPKLYEEDPTRRLALCTYPLSGSATAKGMERIYQEISQLIQKTPGVEGRGGLPKSQFYRLLAEAGAMLYPTAFPEISCIAAIEAMAAGCPVITTDDYALSETVPYAKELGLDRPLAKDYSPRFIEKTREVMSSDFLYRRLQSDGKKWIQGKYGWDKIAREWDARAKEIFEERFANNKRRIYDQLVYQSDIVAAGALSEHTGLVDKWVSNVLDNHHKTPDDYHTNAGGDPNAGWETNPRFAMVTALVPKGRLKVLDVGCGGGGLALHMKRNRPELSVAGVDFSPGLIELAKQAATILKEGERPEFLCEDADKLPGAAYDVVTSCEVLEHQIDTQAFVGKLEALCKKNGTVILTVPSGPWEAMSFSKVNTAGVYDRDRPHVHHFEERDLREIFGRKKSFSCQYMNAGQTQRGETIGWWIVSYQKDDAETGSINYERKWKTTRPYQKIAACLIVRNEEDNLARCLKSVVEVVDEIHVTDTGSSDSTKAIVEAWTLQGRHVPKIFLHEATWADIRPTPYDASTDQLRDERLAKEERIADRRIEELQLIDFAKARNLSVAGAVYNHADWIFWIDADEYLKNGANLRRYLSTTLNPSLTIRQNHMTSDAALDVDKPFRVYRPSFNGRPIEFRGVIHEQPTFALNENAEPCLELPDVDIIHWGYLDEALRRQKCIVRNMPLVVKDRFVNPERHLGLVNVARDKLHVARFQCDQHGMVTEEAKKILRDVCEIHRNHFADPKHPWHGHSVKHYQQALELMGRLGVTDAEDRLPFEAQIQVAIRPGGFEQNATVAAAGRRWFSSKEEFLRIFSDEAERTFRDFGEMYAGRKESSDSSHPVPAEARVGEELRDAGSAPVGGGSGQREVRPELEAPGATASQ